LRGIKETYWVEKATREVTKVILKKMRETPQLGRDILLYRKLFLADGADNAD